MALVEVKVPDIGDFEQVAVIEVLVEAGDLIKAEQSLITVESDKASMEIPSSHAGRVQEVRLQVGDQVSQGSVILLLDVVAVDAAAAVAASRPAVTGPAAEVTRSEPAPAAAPAAGSRIEVVVPDIGDFEEVAVIELLVVPGDVVRAEQSLITVESDKASMEIPSPSAGTVERLLVKIGDTVSKGTPIVLLTGAGGGALASGPAVAAAPAATAPGSPDQAERALASKPVGRLAPTAALPPHEPAVSAGHVPHASPSVRRIARELGVPLAEVKGSGPKGRITPEDVQSFVKGVMAGDTLTSLQAAKVKAPAAGAGGGGIDLLPWPKLDFAKFGPVERKELGRIRKISGANLHRNWVVIPHVTNHDDADITELESFRVQLNKENEKSGIKVTMLAFLIKACVSALKQFPEFNASLDGEHLVLKKYFHIGFAADTPNGLVVPVIKDADQKGILQISKEMNELAAKAREGKLSPGEMSGGCISISSLGGIGGRYFTPIINAPEVAILGVCRSSIEPRWDGQAFKPRLMLPLSLSWDHRVIDGASAARFNAYLAALLADFRRVML